MHLADITMFFTPHSGGVRRYLLAKRAWLARHRSHLRHSLLVPAYPMQESARDVLQHDAAPLPFSGGYRFPLLKRAWVKTLVELRPDVIEAGDPYRLAWAALDAGQRLGVPVIGFYHSDTRGVLRSLMGAGAGPLIDHYIRELYNRFDLVLAPSHSICRDLRALGVARVVRQPLGIDTTVFHPGRRDPSLRAELGLAPQTRLLIYAGRSNSDKNTDVLIESFARLGKPYHLLLVGHRFRFRGTQANVSHYPYQHDARALARLLASADALVHAGTQETFGLVVTEAMASGIPVIALNKEPVAELLTDETGMLVDEADSRAFAAGIKTLYTKDLSRLGCNARAHAERSWDWNALMPELLNRYTTLARMQPASLPQVDRVVN